MKELRSNLEAKEEEYAKEYRALQQKYTELEVRTHCGLLCLKTLYHYEHQTKYGVQAAAFREQQVLVQSLMVGKDLEGKRSHDCSPYGEPHRTKEEGDTKLKHQQATELVVDETSQNIAALKLENAHLKEKVSVIIS